MTTTANLYPVPEMDSVAVYCSASSAIDQHFLAAARTIGAALAQNRLRMVFGGGRVGLMGEAAKACKTAGGRVTGITTEKLDAIEGLSEHCDESRIVATMPERRSLMMELADAFVILPGGLGTYEEFFEVVVGRQLGDHAKPIVIVNHNHFYDPMMAMIDHGIEHKFIRPAIREALIVVDDAADALPALIAYRPGRHDPADYLYLPEHDDQPAELAQAS